MKIDDFIGLKEHRIRLVKGFIKEATRRIERHWKDEGNWTYEDGTIDNSAEMPQKLLRDKETLMSGFLESIEYRRLTETIGWDTFKPHVQQKILDKAYAALCAKRLT